jgi:hypothetical protein
MLLNVLLWIVYDPGRAFFGVYTWAGRVGVLSRWIPALMDIVILQHHRSVTLHTGSSCQNL